MVEVTVSIGLFYDIMKGSFSCAQIGVSKVISEPWSDRLVMGARLMCLQVIPKPLYKTCRHLDFFLYEFQPCKLFWVPNLALCSFVGMWARKLSLATSSGFGGRDNGKVDGKGDGKAGGQTQSAPLIWLGDTCSHMWS